MPRFGGAFLFFTRHSRIYSTGYVSVTHSHFDVLLPS